MDKKYTKPNQEEIKKKLNELEYRVTQEDATERPFTHEYNDLYEDGIYVDIVSGEPLFALETSMMLAVAGLVLPSP